MRDIEKQWAYTHHHLHPGMGCSPQRHSRRIHSTRYTRCNKQKKYVKRLKQMCRVKFKSGLPDMQHIRRRTENASAYSTCHGPPPHSGSFASLVKRERHRSASTWNRDQMTAGSWCERLGNVPLALARFVGPWAAIPLLTSSGCFCENPRCWIAKRVDAEQLSSSPLSA